MIEIKGVSKTFGKVRAVDGATLDIADQGVFGLIGTNGAGKSTILRMVSGILKPDMGSIRVDKEPVYENAEIKKSLFYISDDSYVPVSFTPEDMALFCRNYYPSFRMERFYKLMMQFQLDKKQRIQSFSKGMRKQLSVILGISAGTKYLLCDETFDGLDPVMRQAVKSLFAAEIMNREFAPVIASHNLRELEDICDRVGLIHKGGVLLSKDIEELKFHIHKIQCVLKNKEQETELFKEMDILKMEHQGSLLLITARGTKLEILERVQSKSPLFCEVIPLTLEEIFISETEVTGYEVKNFFNA